MNKGIQTMQPNPSPKALAENWNSILRAALIEACDAIESHARMCFIVCGKPDDEQGFHDAWADEDNEDYWRWVRLKQVAGVPRFRNVYCSACGSMQGPGDEGFSHCCGHQRRDTEHAA